MSCLFTYLFISLFILGTSSPLFTLRAFLLFIYTTTHCSLLRLIVRSGLDVQTFVTRRLHACHHARAPSGGRWNCEQEMSGKFYLNVGFHVTFRDLLHVVKLRHGTDGYTSPPKEGVLRIFFAPKIRRLRPGLNPRTWVPKASTLPLDHRTRSQYVLLSFLYASYSPFYFPLLISSFPPTIPFRSFLCYPPSTQTAKLWVAN